MQALTACSEAPWLFSNPFCATYARKNSFRKRISAVATSSPAPDKSCIIRNGQVIRCSFVSVAGTWNNKSRQLQAALETETILEEPVEEHTVAITEEHTVTIPEDSLISDLPTVGVKFVLERECQFGEKYNVLGNDPLFGNWDPEARVPMEWSEGHRWSVEKDVPIGKHIEFKFVLTGQDEEIKWQPGANRCFETTDPTISPLIVCSPWDSEEEEIEEGKPEAPVEEGTEAATVLPDASLAHSDGTGNTEAATVLPDASLAHSDGTGNQVSNEEILTKRDIPVDEGNGQLPVSVSSDDEDKPDTASELTTPDPALVAAVIDAAQINDFQS